MTKIRMVGDLILDAPDPAGYFDPARRSLSDADLVIGHVEIPHTLGGEEISTDVATPATSPDNLRVLGGARVGVATLAGNHIADRGAAGIVDTLAALRAQGIATAGAGLDLDEARAPAVVEAAGRRVDVLSINCVGPDVSKATSVKPGAAYLDVTTVYGRPFGGPGGVPMSTDTFADRRQLERLVAQVSELRERVDVVVVAFHKGVLHIPIEIAEYERDISHAVIDAGADVVIGHHAHILKGIEVYRGRPVFHGLGNFVTVTSALADGDGNSPERRAWAQRRRRMTGFDPDPTMPFYPFHPQSRNTLIAQVEVTRSGIEAAFLPCWIDDAARPVPLTGDRGREVVDYVQQISRDAGFDVDVEWDGEIARVRADR